MAFCNGQFNLVGKKDMLVAGISLSVNVVRDESARHDQIPLRISILFAPLSRELSVPIENLQLTDRAYFKDR